MSVQTNVLCLVPLHVTAAHVTDHYLLANTVIVLVGFCYFSCLLCAKCAMHHYMYSNCWCLYRIHRYTEFFNRNRKARSFISKLAMVNPKCNRFCKQHVELYKQQDLRDSPSWWIHQFCWCFKSFYEKSQRNFPNLKQLNSVVWTEDMWEIAFRKQNSLKRAQLLFLSWKGEHLTSAFWGF